jgi:hypothetical protein
MNSKRILKHNFKVFFLGMITLIIIESIFDWKSSVESFKKGLHYCKQ